MQACDGVVPRRSGALKVACPLGRVLVGGDGVHSGQNLAGSGHRVLAGTKPPRVAFRPWVPQRAITRAVTHGTLNLAQSLYPQILASRRAGDQRRNAVAGAEAERLAQDAQRTRNWKRWGPYLSERQWGTVREDYSEGGDCWNYFPHDHARSRAYRWGEDGLLGITDRQGRMCFALTLWNGRDPILKERLFGVTGPEGNHGEDVKELYYYLDSTPTHSYLKALYKYPQAEFPYEALVRGNRERGKQDPEFELLDTRVFDGGRYFDVFAEYAKADTDDILIRITVANRGPEDATLHLLPTLWFRNTWSWGRTGEGYWPRGVIRAANDGGLEAEHASLGRYRLDAEPVDGAAPELLFTENETNATRLYGSPSAQPFVKDAFHRAVVQGEREAVNPAGEGSKAAFRYTLTV